MTGFDLLRPFLDRHEPRTHTFATNMPGPTKAERDRLRAALRAAESTHPREVALLRAEFNEAVAEGALWQRDVRAAFDYLAAL
jgi:hypothetical protein